MASPSQLVITLTDSTVHNVPIASALQNLDSGQSASTQTGFSAVEVSVANICKRGGFWDGTATFYPLAQIKSISWS